MKISNKIHIRQGSLIVLVALLPLLCLVLFLDKPVHMDDPGYLWPARQILKTPLDFYGFPANWYGFEVPMSLMNKNPPLASYFIALAVIVAGWNEVALHIAFLIPALGLIAGTYFLAEAFTRRPVVAALTATACPVYLVSATSMMCDTLMVSLYVCAAALWVRGEEREKPWMMALGSVLIGLSAMAKYYGITLVPLLVLYSVGRNQGVLRRLGLLLIPLSVLIAYEFVTFRLYGTGLLADAASYSVIAGETRSWGLGTKILTGLSFTGGCLGAVAFFAPVMWRPRVWIGGLISVAMCGAIVLGIGTIGNLTLRGPESIRWGLALQLALFVVAGIQVIALAVADWRTHRDSGSLLLLLWIAGAFVFTTFINWTTNGRTVLPMVPAAGILVARRLELMLDRGALGCRRPESVLECGDVGSSHILAPESSSAPSKAHSGNFQTVSIAFPLLAAFCLSLSVAYADYSLAWSQCIAAREIKDEFRDHHGTLWFQGHWGFQYYMESLGGKPVDFNNLLFDQGDVMIVPSNNTNVRQPGEDIFHSAGKRRFMPFPWMATMEKTLGAGFYSDKWGPLPYAVGRVAPAEYEVFLIGTFENPAEAVNRIRRKRSDVTTE
jgi:4-amino-4-deoxy-L-arabinose transferase-like glycosyltransferase